MQLKFRIQVEVGVEARVEARVEKRVDPPVVDGGKAESRNLESRKETACGG
jgi:hypothetical protein